MRAIVKRPGDDAASTAEEIRWIESLLDEGQVFLAQDAAQRLRAADDADPHVLCLHAFALARSGATDAAERLLAPLAKDFALDERVDRQAFAALRAMVDLAAADPGAAPIEDVRRALDAARTTVAGLMSRTRGARLAPETLTLIGDCLVEIWRRTARRDLPARAQRVYEDAAREGGRQRPIAMARLLSMVAGGAADADHPSHEGATRGGEAHEAFWRDVAHGAAALSSGDFVTAEAALIRARSGARATSHRTTILRELLEACAEAQPPAADLARVFSPPRIVVFTGLPFDRAGAPARCPAALEAPLRAAIRARLDELDAEIGYASAACGSDLLFIDAMLERGGETNIVLPFDRDDFVAERVAYGGPAWIRRFEIAEKLAASVSCATPGPYLGDDDLYRFGNQALHGAATMRGRQYGVSPDLVTVWDLSPGTETGDVADFIDRWADMRRLHIIDVDDVAAAAPAAPTAEPADPPVTIASATGTPALVRSGGDRKIRALLMSDIVGSSRVTEAQMPAYATFMRRIAARLAERAPAPAFVNTWGDAIFATSASAEALATYALALKDAVAEFGHLDGAIAAPLGMRISLNAGPVLEAEDAIVGRMGNFGEEIVRAARIEPVTTPNHIYSTDSFVSLLLAEESEARAAAEMEGRPWASRFRLEYIGRVALAKNAGAEGLHHLSAAPEAETEVSPAEREEREGEDQAEGAAA